MSVGQRSTLGVVPQEAVDLVLGEQDLSLVWNLTHRLGWLANDPQGSAYICFPAQESQVCATTPWLPEILMTSLYPWNHLPASFCFKPHQSTNAETGAVWHQMRNWNKKKVATSLLVSDSGSNVAWPLDILRDSDSQSLEFVKYWQGCFRLDLFT